MFTMNEQTLVVAAIEILAAMFCVVSIFMEMLQKNQAEKGSRIIKRLLACACVCLVFDGISFLVNGNAAGNRTLLNKVALLLDFSGFMCSILLMYMYITKQLSPRCQTKLTHVTRTVYGVITIDFFMLITNPITNVLYVVDHNNNYIKHNGIWIYFGVLTFISLLILVLTIRDRKHLGKLITVAFITTAVVMIVGGVLEVVLTDFPGSNIGLGLGMMCLSFVHKTRRSRMNEENSESRRMVIIMYMFMVMTMCIFAAFIINILKIIQVSKDRAESDGKVIAQMVSESIDNAFIKPIMVSETMCQSSTLKDAFFEDYEMELDMPHKRLVEYLDSIREGMGYQMVFAVSNLSHKYYTYNGISKIVDPENDSHDIWYKLFLECGKHYDLDVDTDEAANWSLSVFVNTEVLDNEGNVIGVCGVGVSMEDLQKLLVDYEKRYNIDIALIDETGLVQVDTDGENIEVAVMDHDYLSKVTSDSFLYERIGDTSRMTKFMQDLDWYVVVTDNNPEKINVSDIIRPGLIASVIGIVFLIMAYVGIQMYDRKMEKVLLQNRDRVRYFKRMSEIDELTGIHNRHAYEEDKKKWETPSDKTGEITPVVGPLAVIMMDVNGLKTVNDQIGHTAGDELIIGAANVIKKVFGGEGRVYRTGGDEFVAVLRSEKETAERMLAELEKETGEFCGELVKELAISAGCAGTWEFTDRTFDEMVHIADERMYEAKNEYYRRTGKSRRISW